MFQLLVIIPYVERSGAGMLLTLCVLLSEWCARFGAGIVVPLECRCKVLPEGDVWRCCCQSGVCCKPCFGAGMLVSGCRWKVLLEGAVELACWCCCKGWCFRVLQGGYVLYPTRAARVLCEGRCCTLQGAAVRVACPLWSWLVVPLQSAASRCCS